VVNAAARTVRKTAPEVRSLSDVFRCWFPSLSLEERQRFLDDLILRLGADERQLAEEARLYLTTEQIRSLPEDFEIGNHTYSHVRCRALLSSDLAPELDNNQAVLAALSGKRVRSFSVPYGSSKDLTVGVLRRLEDTGHQAIFLSESVANCPGGDLHRLDRVSVQARSSDALFSDLEVLPRIRALRNRLLRSARLRPEGC
jgi:peptidoglycan/xylan/chitin deacetylase (PgdA/CDA1 family)